MQSDIPCNTSADPSSSTSVSSSQPSTESLPQPSPHPTAEAAALWLEADFIAEQCDREWAAVAEADGGPGTTSAVQAAGISSVRRMRAELKAEEFTANARLASTEH